MAKRALSTKRGFAGISPLVANSSPTGGAKNIVWAIQRHFSFAFS